MKPLTAMGRAGRQLAQGALQLIFPAICGACGCSLRVSEAAARPASEGAAHEVSGPVEKDFCSSCRSILTTDPFPTCPRCAASIGPHAAIQNGCTHCRDSHFQFEKVIRLGPYDGLLRELILRLKHGSGETLAELLGELWAEHASARLREADADMVIPVPLHWWRRFRRGYNQSEALACRLAARVGLPCRPGWLRRIRYTPQQTSQTPELRKENVRGAFRARPWARLRGKAVLLVDDVLTSGTTCSEAARALRAGGAARVTVAVLARSHSLANL